MKRTRIRRKTPIRSKYRPGVKELDALCRQVVFQRDGGKCIRCGKEQNAQWAHVDSRRYRSTRWLPDNSMVLCAGCHLWWHHRPREAVEWWAKTYPGRNQMITLASRPGGKTDLALTLIYLKSLLNGVTT